MPACAFCPERWFVDDNAVRMHKDARHWWCQSCDKLFSTEEALDQHNSAKHSPMFECEYCEREFSTDKGRLAHQEAKHPSMFECEYCDKEFTTDEGRLAHEKVKHPPMFECEYCDREFTTDEGRLAHEKVKHPSFECEYCDREFSSEDALRQHEQAKHPPTYECRHCDREFTSEWARTQHEDSIHPTVCNICAKSFASPEALEQHMETKKHLKCDECASKFRTEDGLNAHKKACHRPSVVSVSTFSAISRPAPPSTPSLFNFGQSTRTSSLQRFGPAASTPSDPEPPKVENLASSAISDSEASSGDDEASRDAFSTPQEGDGDGAVVEQSQCACKICQRSSAACACTICQRASPVSSRTGVPAGDDAGNIIPADPVGQEDPAVERQVRCTSCFNLVDAKALGDHVCASFENIVPLHCSSCYTQFDEQSSLQEHLEGRSSFLCQLCAMPCCSSEMLQDHLLSHPGCGRCGEFFLDDPSLCKHLETAHPVVVCWDCDGAVVEQNSLELHYTESPVHPSCSICGMGKRNAGDLDEHVRNDHPGIVCPPEAGSLSSNPDREAAADEQASQGGDAGVRNDSDVSDPLTPSSHPQDIYSSILTMPPQTRYDVEAVSTPSVVQEPSLSIPAMPTQTRYDVEAVSTPSFVQEASSSILTMSLEVQSDVRADIETVSTSSVVQKPVELASNRDVSPSSTPSEHGSNGSRSRMFTRNPETNDHVASQDDSEPQSLASSMLAESFSDISSPTSSSHSIVYVSAEGIPDYVRENRAYLVATSAASPSSGCTPLRLPSTHSLDSSLGVPTRAEPRDNAAPVSDIARSSTNTTTYRLHCRICLRDPCEDMTATICGHLFCKRCITAAVVSKPECPVCKNATLLYCLFKLDLSV